MQTKTEIPKIKVSFDPKTKINEIIYVRISAEAEKILPQEWNTDTICLLEEFKVLFLDNKNAVIGVIDLNRGNHNYTPVNIKLLFSIALLTNCSGIILAHNHPSGRLKPSKADKILTAQITKACKLFNLELLDHLILGAEGYFSFADEGMLT